jgi:hypothetical protein
MTTAGPAAAVVPGPTTFLGIRFSLVKFCFDNATLLDSVDLLASVRSAQFVLDRQGARRSY